MKHRHQWQGGWMGWSLFLGLAVAGCMEDFDAPFSQSAGAGATGGNGGGAGVGQGAVGGEGGASGSGAIGGSTPSGGTGGAGGVVITGGTAGSTGGTAGSTGGTAGSTGGTAGSTGGTAGSTGGTAGSTGGTAGSTGGTAGGTGGSGAMTGLVNWWKFDDGSGTTAMDSAGSNHGTLINGPAWVAGRVGGALRFDGVDDRVQASPPKAFRFDDEFTLSAWIKIRNCQDNGSKILEIKHNSSNSMTMQCYMGTDALTVGVRFGGTLNAIDGVTPINDDNWHHVVAVKDGNELRSYVDGEMEVFNSVAWTTGVISDGDVWIGDSLNGGTRKVEGIIDDVRIYDIALPIIDILYLYNCGLAGAC